MSINLVLAGLRSKWLVFILYWKCYWSLYPSVHPLSPDNAMESERKRNSVKMQPRKVKIKSLVGPLFSKQVWGPQGSIPSSPPLPPLGWPGQSYLAGWQFHVQCPKFSFPVNQSYSAIPLSVWPCFTASQQPTKIELVGKIGYRITTGNKLCRHRACNSSRCGLRDYRQPNLTYLVMHSTRSPACVWRPWERRRLSSHTLEYWIADASSSFMGVAA